MIFIVVKFSVLPERADEWPTLVRELTEATRAEPGNLFFDWSRSVDDPNEFVLVEAFLDDAAEAHVTAPHFKQAQADLPQYLQATPKIVNFAVPGNDWSALGEMEVK